MTDGEAELALPLDLHELPFGGLVAVLFVGAMIRANATYWLGRAAVAGGRRTRLRARLDTPAMARAETFVARWGVAAVPLCFLTVGVQTAVNLGAGATRMPLRRYLPAVCVGAALWAVLYATVGLAAFAAGVGLAARSPWAVVALVAAVASILLLRRRRARRAPGQRTPDASHRRTP